MERIKRINELLKREVSMAILKEVEWPDNVLVTVLKIETSSDLDHCKVFVSAFPQKEIQKVLAVLNRRSHDLHQILNDKVTIRRVPKLKFVEGKDIQKLEQILQGLEK